LHCYHFHIRPKDNYCNLMITIHYNGDVVSGPDMVRAAEDRKIRNDKNRQCIYGRDEIKCDTWLAHCKDQPEIKKISDFGRCSLHRCDKCPMYQLRVKAGNQIKKYKIDSKDYRKLSSGSHWLLKHNKNKLVFFVLTFPPTLKKHKLTKSFYLNETSNQYFSKFVENLKENYNCSGYVAVKEIGSKFGRCHFHILACFPFVNLMRLNNAWCSTIKTICEYSNHALQTRRGHRIVNGDTGRAVRYICKYISTTKKLRHESYSRLVFISNNLLHKKMKYDDINPSELLKGYKSIFISTFDFVTIFRITDPKSFDDFCNNVIYSIFDD